MGVFKWAATSQFPPPPQRRRAVIIGAGPTGLSAAFHLGEHSLLLERRQSLEDSNDQSHVDPMGVARSGAVGREGVSCAERKALFISCSSSGKGGTDEHTLIHVSRWQPPEFDSKVEHQARHEPPSARALVPLLRGDLRLGAHVVRISPSTRLIELANGDRYVFDKMISTLSLQTMALLVMHDLPARIRHDESLRYWLGDHDIEIADRATMDYYGDIDEFSAGKRVAEQIGDALTAKFRNAGYSSKRGTRLFVPRLVQKAAAPAMS